MKNKYVKERKNSLLKVYLLALFVLGIISVLNTMNYFFTKHNLVEINPSLVFYASMAVFVFSVYSFASFRREKLSNITLILPAWIVIEWLLLMVFISASYSFFPADKLEALISSAMFTGFNLFYNLVQLGFICYLLYIFYYMKTKQAEIKKLSKKTKKR